MQKLLHFDSPVRHYRADACVVSCRKFLKRRGVLAADHVKIAGAAKWLSSPEHEDDRDFVLRQIRTSMRRHGSERVLLFLHSDCGAYGGLASFQNDPARELAAMRAELGSAERFVRLSEPALEVESYFVNFEGVWTPA